MNRFVWSVMAMAALAGCASGSPEQQLRDRAVAALGGRDLVQNVTTLLLEGRGYAANLGQDMTWESTGQRFELTDVRRVFDLTGPRSRAEQTRTPNFLYFQGSQPQHQIVGFDGDLAYSVTAKGTAVRQAASAARDRRLEFYHHPLTLVHAMLNPATGVANVQADNGGHRADVTIGDTTFDVSFDAQGRPLRVASPSAHANLGDITVTTEFSDYTSVEGVQLPLRLTTRVDTHVTMELQGERYVVNDTSATAVAPDDAVSAAEPSPAAPRVEVIEVARGVWLLGGQSHHSALVEFADHLTLIEAPQSEARTLAVIARARELVPAKPLTELVVSHHHFDHSAGLRAAVAEGLAVITHSANAAFVEEITSRPHTRQPDALQKTEKRPLTLRTVDAPLTLQDQTMTMVVYPLPGNPHGDTIVMAYLPQHRLVIQADAYSPGGSYHPYAANLLETIRANKLAVERIVPLHGGVVPFDDLVKTVNAQR